VTAINTAPVISPAPAAAPGDAIKSTNADQKALAGKFIGFGDASFAKQKYLAAIGRYKTAIETAPDVPDAYFRQGLAHVALGQYASAAKAFRRGLVVRSSWRGSPIRLDTLYGPAGQQIKIQHLEALAQAVESNPFDAELLLVLGMSLYFDGQNDRAELCFGRVTQLSGDGQQLLRDFLPPPGPAGATPPAKPSGRVSF
jgi:tetratricopeptide (TPR) repeat protein